MTKPLEKKNAARIIQIIRISFEFTYIAFEQQFEFKKSRLNKDFSSAGTKDWHETSKVPFICGSA